MQTTATDLRPPALGYRGQMLVMAAAAVVAWAAFLALYRLVWPAPFTDPDSAAAFLGWLAGGTALAGGTVWAVFRVLRTPRRWQVHGVIAQTAPAMLFDAVTTRWFDSVFPASTVLEGRVYPALILGGVALVQLVVIARGDDPERR